VTVEKGRKLVKGDRRVRRSTTGLGAIGIEAEFATVVDGEPAKPEDVFGSPTSIVRAPMMHRTGRSYHLPTGGAVYFDTGVIELATPVIEIERGCAARAGRSLWESIHYLRDELDAWEEREQRSVHLAGFSTHYNVSFDVPYVQRGHHRSVEQLALLLTHILPMPVMLLAANRRSTGIGVRPRVNRVEVTADFTPDAELMIATATFIVGVAREVMTWPTFDLGALDSRDFPLRAIAQRITHHFWPSITRLGDPRSLRLISAVMRGRRASLLELDDRPPAYESVGRSCTWANLFPLRSLARSKYERIFIRAISGRRLRLDGESYTPTGMRGWSHVVFLRDRDRSRRVLSLDFLLRHDEAWER
jgi:hypothetical protein